MKIRADKLREIVKLLGPVIPQKTTIPITQNILLKEGKAIGNNLETQVSIYLPDAMENHLLPFDQLSDITPLIPSLDEITIETANKNISLSWPGGKAVYPTADSRDFPEINNTDTPQTTGEVDGDALINTISSMAKYVAVETSRPILNAVHLKFGNPAQAYAADGFRLIYQPLPFSYGNEGWASINPNTIRILEHLWKRDPRSAPQATQSLIETLTAKRKIVVEIINKDTCTWISFKFGRVKIVSTLVEGTPPEFMNLIPTPKNKIIVLAPIFYQAVMRAKDIACAGAGIVRLKWEENSMDVYAVTEEMGEVSTTIPIEALDGPGCIALNAKYLLEYLSGKDGVITMGTTSPSSPALFEYYSSPIAVIMPMFVQW